MRLGSGVAVLLGGNCGGAHGDDAQGHSVHKPHADAEKGDDLGKAVVHVREIREPPKMVHQHQHWSQQVLCQPVLCAIKPLTQVRRTNAGDKHRRGQLNERELFQQQRVHAVATHGKQNMNQRETIQEPQQELHDHHRLRDKSVRTRWCFFSAFDDIQWLCTE